MTLIAGIVLPNGILIASDTRHSIEKTDEIDNDYIRKITIVTPNCILGTSGSESSFYTAKILRNCLYNNAHALDNISLRSYILNFYNDVNDFHSKTHINNHPIGSALLANYDDESNSFTLFSVKNYIGLTEPFTHSKVGAIELIGANEKIQDKAKIQIQTVLQSLTEDQLNATNAYENIARQCQTIFQQVAKEHVGISDKLYVVYLTTLHKKPAVACFLLEENGTLHNIDREQDGEIISYTR
ncbi:hypothetical protein FO497_29205 [Bacillus cereus ATCC 10876]|uniref:hypothetical protein n=1 Tax=Bacillus TaxID=1386 RepID=UPI00019FF0D3|nr:MULTISPECIES: hypothetical protein [Bacillus]MDJ0281005.1 hypothetical protein [Bacillus bombysepticus]EEK50738.1 hypothetical protein bcere0002_22380 [Bacillus cereus ATCC 10876]KFL74434.1 hypothetical protein DJ50_1108 [Bacillus cereus ATCC 10876]MBG9868771.1 hypothetical protein [Bacillus cereus]MBO1127965.1 hypothetical protein [Bacillus cereus]